MNIKTGDNVIMLQGKDRGKKGKVLNVLPQTKSGSAPRIIVEGLNTIKRHQKARKQGQKGQIVERERAVNISIAQVICPKCDKPSRVGHKKDGKKKLRICKKCNAEF
ncbi:MAG: 50S ribosomal protein L24 [Parcubacteria group bacterium]